MAAQDPEQRLDEVVTVLLAQGGDQVVLSQFGIHFFKAGKMILVGELGADLAAMFQSLRRRAHMSASDPGGMLALMTPDGRLQMLRIDFAPAKDGSVVALLRRPSNGKSWPRPMLPSGYQLAA